jgi:carboxypeptidase C (cathepsin A)
MKRMIRRAACVAAIVTSSVGAQQVERYREPELVATRHQIRLNGSTLSYTARVGLIPIRNNETGEVHGTFSFVSYSVDRAPGQPRRPVTFVWNGGPGANSTTVQFVGFGPRRLRSADDPAHPTPVEPGFYDNDATWLDFTDLVFVDPVGTGFARPAKPEYAAEFYSTLGDIASTADFLRVYLTRFDLLDAPVFVAGESYGTWRAAGAAEALEKKGIHVTGVILISGGAAAGRVASDAVRTALFVPARTATAFYHKKLAPELMRDEKAALDQARRWAIDKYAPAWDRRDSLSDAERDRIITELAYYTGVDASAIDRKALMMTSPQFTDALLRDQQLTLGRYDMRITQPSGGGRGGGEAGDGGARSQIIMNYLRHELRFNTDLTYQGLEAGYSSTSSAERGGGPGSRWNWNQGEVALATGDAAAARAAQATAGSGDGPPGGSQPWIRRAMILDPSLKVFVAAGEYDSLNSCAGNEYLVAHIEPQFGRNITSGCYGGGHMMYDTKTARLQLKREIAAFVKSAVR